MMICAIAHEIAARIPQGRTILGHPLSCGKVQGIRGLEAEELGIEIDALGQVHGVEAKMPESPDLEGPL